MKIEIGKDFSRTPGGRRISDGPDSGQLFRDRILAPALERAVERKEKLVVVLDGPRGYLSSFLEEAFGGLIRRNLFPKSQLHDYLDVRAIDPFYDPYRRLVLKYIEEAETQSPSQSQPRANQH